MKQNEQRFASFKTNRKIVMFCISELSKMEVNTKCYPIEKHKY